MAEEREGTYEELRLESFRRVLAAHDIHDPDLPAWMVDGGWPSGRRPCELHADVEPELDDALAAAGHVLGAITNGNFPFAQLGWRGGSRSSSTPSSSAR